MSFWRPVTPRASRITWYVASEPGLRLDRRAGARDDRRQRRQPIRVGGRNPAQRRLRRFGHGARLRCRPRGRRGDPARAAPNRPGGGATTTVIHCPVAPGETPPSGAFWDLGVPEVATDPTTQHRLTRE